MSTPKADIATLIRALKHRNQSPTLTRSSAIYELASIGNDAIDPLIAALVEDLDPEVRGGAAEALGHPKLRPIRAISALITALADPEAQVRWCAAHALAAIGAYAPAATSSEHERMVPALAALLQDQHTSVRYSAVHAFSTLGPGAKGAVGALIAAFADDELANSLQVESALARIGEASVPALITVLSDPRNPFRARAATTLYYLGRDAHQAAPALIAALEDEKIRMCAGEALRHMGPEVQELIPARWQSFVSTAFIDRYYS